MIIAVVGMPGAGKSVFCRWLEEAGWPVIYFGGLVLKEVARRGLEAGQASERAVREDLRRTLGMDAMAQLARPEIEAALASGGRVLIDGLYSQSEYRTLKAAFGEQLVVVAIVAPRRLRHARLASRPERPLDAAAAEARDLTEIETLEKGGPIALADYFIINDADQMRFEEAAQQMLQTLDPR